MIQRAEQANIVGLRSKDFVQWVEQNIDAPLKRGPGGAILERLKGGLVGGLFSHGQGDSTGAVRLPLIWRAVELAGPPGPRDGFQLLGGLLRPPPPPHDALRPPRAVFP